MTLEIRVLPEEPIPEYREAGQATSTTTSGREGREEQGEGREEEGEGGEGETEGEGTANGGTSTGTSADYSWIFFSLAY